MGDTDANADVRGERRRDAFWLMVALGLVVALKSMVLILDLATVLK